MINIYFLKRSNNANGLKDKDSVTTSGDEKSEDKDNEDLFDPDTSEAVLDATKVKYTEESDRFKQVEVKTNIALAFTGALFGIFIKYVSEFEPQDVAQAALIYNVIFKFLIFIFLSGGVFFLLQAVTAGEYEQIGLNNIVDEGFAKKHSPRTKLEIAATFKEAIDNNKKELDKKYKKYGYGLFSLKWGFSLFAIHILIEEVIRFV